MPVALCAVDHAKPDALTAGVERTHAEKPVTGADALPVEKPVTPVALLAVDHAKPDVLAVGVEKTVRPVELFAVKPADALPVEKPVMLVALRAADTVTPDALPAAVAKPVMPVALPDALPAAVEKPVTPVALHVAAPADIGEEYLLPPPANCCSVSAMALAINLQSCGGYDALGAVRHWFVSGSFPCNACSCPPCGQHLGRGPK